VESEDRHHQCHSASPDPRPRRLVLVLVPVVPSCLVDFHFSACLAQLRLRPDLRRRPVRLLSQIRAQPRPAAPRIGPAAVVQAPRVAILLKRKRKPLLDTRNSKPVTATDIRRTTIRPTTLEVREGPALSRICLGEGLVKYHDCASSYLGDFCLLWSSTRGSVVFLSNLHMRRSNVF
jgi:hypothetical protein